MPLSVRHAGSWKNVTGLSVRRGTTWQSLQYLFVKTGETVTWPHMPPETGDIPTITPIWKVVRSFVPPPLTPATPSVNNWDPKDGPPPVEIPTPQTVYVTLPIVPDDPIYRSWAKEIRFLLGGFETGANVTITDPNTTRYTEVWYRGAGNLQVQTRYTNEAGVGPWSAMSNSIAVQVP